MDTFAILNALRTKRDRLNSAIAALEGTRSGRGQQAANRSGQGRGGRRRRKMSEAAKKRISRMMKKRWRERKAALKR